MLVFFFIFFLSINNDIKAVDSKVINPFTTDLCTFYKEGSWSHCCLKHDLYFWAGGTKDERKDVDLELKECVKQAGGKVNADIIYLGVKLGSLSPLKIKGKQWGNAWSRKVRNTPLNSQDILQLEESLIENSEIDVHEIDLFIDQLNNRLE